MLQDLHRVLLRLGGGQNHGPAGGLQVSQQLCDSLINPVFKHALLAEILPIVQQRPVALLPGESVVFGKGRL